MPAGANEKRSNDMQGNGFITVGAWKVNVPEDIEIYSSDKRTAELIPHSQYGYRFREDSSLAEKDVLRGDLPP
jgi:hypothetical protein